MKASTMELFAKGDDEQVGCRFVCCARGRK